MINKLYGPPGTGKTTRLIDEIRRSNIPLSDVAFISYTKRAINVARGRLENEEEELNYFRTQHSMNFRLLGLTKSQVADKKLKEFCEKKKVKLSDEIIDNTKQTTLDSKLADMNWRKLDVIDDKFYKRMQMDRLHLKVSSDNPLFSAFKKKYFDWLKENNYIDFIGMIEKGIENMVIPPVKLLCVDEWQDLSPLQAKQIKIWTENISESFHAGDDDQSINVWAGASSQEFLNFASGIANEEVLEKTFRLPANILRLSQNLIRRNKFRKEKKVVTDKKDGFIGVGSLSRICEVIKKLTNKNEKCVFLVRNNLIKKKLKKDLISFEVPIEIPMSEGRAVNLMLTAKKTKRLSFDDLQTIISPIFPASRYFKRGSKKKMGELPDREGGWSFDNLVELGVKDDFFNDIFGSNFNYLKIDNGKYIVKMIQLYGDNYKPVGISTIHSYKGDEADNVVLLTDIIGYVAEAERSQSKMEREDERRVWYVGITRAIKNLFIPNNTNYTSWKSVTGDFIQSFLADKSL